MLQTTSLHNNISIHRYSAVAEKNKWNTTSCYMNDTSMHKADTFSTLLFLRPSETRWNRQMLSNAVWPHPSSTFLLYCEHLVDWAVALLWKPVAAQAHNIPPWMESRTASARPFVPAVKTLMVAKAMCKVKRICPHEARQGKKQKKKATATSEGSHNNSIVLCRRQIYFSLGGGQISSRTEQSSDTL